MQPKLPHSKTIHDKQLRISSILLSFKKTHKNTPGIKIRPIVSNNNSPTTKVSWLLQHLLVNLLDTVPAHLKSSEELIDTIKNLNQSTTQTYNYPYSLDVVALYTSIPPQDAINIIQNRLKNKTFNYFGLNSNNIELLLKCVLVNTYFVFNNKTYRQISGLPMGNCLSGTLAIIFMDELEKKVLLNNTVGLYKRYIDDIFILSENKQKAEEFHYVMNHQHPNIKFEIEHPDHKNSLNLLDFNIKLNGTAPPIFSFYKKPALRDIFLHYNSALPTSMKQNVISNELKRIHDRCSEPEQLSKAKKEFYQKLQTTNYPDNFIKQRNSRQKQKGKPKTTTNNVYYFNFPFPYDNIQNKIIFFYGLKSPLPNFAFMTIFFFKIVGLKQK